MGKSKDIMLNFLPPGTVYYPSPSFSILKSFMEKNGYRTGIKYWNFLLNDLVSETLDQEIGDIEAKLMPFYGIIADMNDDTDAREKIIAYLHREKPAMIVNGRNSYFEYLEVLKEKALNIIKTELDKTDFSNILLYGVSYKLYQLIPAIVLAKAVKERSPGTKIVIGGIGSRAVAVEIMERCRHFDYAIWGEGEYPLLELAEHLSAGKNGIENIARLAYRNNGSIKTVERGKSRYLDFDNYILPDYSDYFPLTGVIEQKDSQYYPINSIRSCYWKKCKFCNFNAGYKYRERTPECIVKEIEEVASKYGVKNFMFVDNDIVGTDAERFERLLDLLIGYKKTSCADVHFWCEMIPVRQMTALTVQKMAEANFSSVFIGYESISEGILRKMGKSNDVAQNLFMVKAACMNGLTVRTNLIKGVPDETREDVLESINNLHFLRFLFHRYEYKFRHIHGYFALYREAVYYKEMKHGDTETYNSNPFHYYVSEKQIPKDTGLFAFLKEKIKNKTEWHAYDMNENFYIENVYSYETAYEGDHLVYREKLNDLEISEITFDEPVYTDALRHLNYKVYTFDELYRELKRKYKNLTQEKLKEVINELFDEYLVFRNEDMTSITAVIDV
ncbi:MAG: radical SAM protein [Bacteroidetes bacterium]|nr:radical SAM protein [Bacteroidota bacterium]